MSETYKAGGEYREIEGVPETIIYIDLMRHGNRFAGSGRWEDPETGKIVEFDDSEDLTPEGKNRSIEYGSNLPKDVDYVVGIGSIAPRAIETAEDVEKGAGVIDNGLGTNQVIGMNYKELNGESKKVLKRAKGIINEAAAKSPNYGIVSAEERAKLRERAQELGLKEASKDDVIVEEMAEGIAYNFQALLDIAKGVEDKNIKTLFPVVNHGLFNESFLMKVLKLRNKKTGEEERISSIDELGGFFKPTESFRTKIEFGENGERITCEFTDEGRQKRFVDKELILDLDKVRELADKYLKRLNAKK